MKQNVVVIVKIQRSNDMRRLFE